MFGLFLHRPLAALNWLYLVELWIAPHPHLVVHQPGMLDNYVRVWRVPMHANGVKDNTRQHGQQDGPVNVP